MVLYWGLRAVLIRVLGAVDAVSADRLLNLGHTRQRCVLAILAVEANRVVSVDQLVYRVWADRPPQRGRGVLHNYLSRLRTILAVEDVAIERHAGGYRLVADETSVDLHQFHRLITGARAATDDTHAMALFDLALQLWRGTPFTDLDTPWLTTVRATLEAELHAAQLDRTDAALRCGQHALLLAELSSQAAQQPFDERIAGQLMLALARAGRPADALAAYQHTREALVDQLGLEPGPELRRLHERILRNDPALRPQPPAPPVPAPSAAVVPFQLPADTVHFTGRAKQLARLLDLG